MANFTKAKRLARETLSNFMQDYSPPTPIVEIAQAYGLSVKEIDLEHLSSKVAGFTDLKGGTIFVNKNDNERRQAFTIAHELAHQLMHKDSQRGEKFSVLLRRPLGGSDPDPKEQEANAFAAEILVPMNVLKSKYLDKGISEPNILSTIFGVSQDVINYRIKDAKKEDR